MNLPFSENGKLLSSGILSIASLFFILLLLVAYFSKDKLTDIRNKMYRGLIITSLILIITDIIEIVVRVYLNDVTLLLMAFRLHWGSGIVWFAGLYYYYVSFMDNVKTTEFHDLLNHSKETKIMTVVITISMLIFIFLPFDIEAMQKMSFFPGLAAYFIYGFCAFMEGLLVFHLLKKKTNVEKRDKVTVWGIVLLLNFIFVFQILFPYIGFLAMACTIQMYFLYFAIENPDLFIIKELEKVNQDIERSNRAKTDFLNNMSHEIRTPMNAIVGFSDSLLNSKEFDEKAAITDIKHISSAGNNLLDIVNNILDISKIESGKETLEFKEYSLANVVMELSSIIDSRLADKPVKFIVDVDKTIPSRLYGDSTKIFQVLLNILTNSVKYTEVGKIKLTVTGNTRGNMEDLHIKISDTGYGIKKEDFNKLFEKFSRLENATENEIEGTGLGLVITKRYVDLMGGKIWFESEYQVGTTFYVEITQKIINKEEIGDIYEPINEVKEDVKLDCSGFNILIVDDNKLNLKVASRLLSSYNFNIDSVETGKECIYKVKSDKKYDMIFLDHMMPEMDGIEVLHILRKLDGYVLPPIVALTANAITGMKEMYLKEGFDEYLSKPINVTELNRLILKYFKDKTSNQQEEKEVEINEEEDEII